MTLKQLWPAYALVLVLWLAAPLCAQDEIASMVPQMQAFLKNVSCPSNASAESCASFHKLVDSGSQELTAQFAPAFLDPKIYLIYVVFENSTDRFWVISTGFVQTDSGPQLHMASYGQYQEGQMVTGALSDGLVAVGDDGVATWSSSKDGVIVSYYRTGETSVLSKESWKGSDGGTRTITISVSKTQSDNDPQAPETVTLESPTEKIVRSGAALAFTDR